MNNIGLHIQHIPYLIGYKIEMNKVHIQLLFLIITVFLIPLIPFWIGNFYEKKMEDTDDEGKITHWRNARLFYRQAEVAPWMWLPIEKKSRLIDKHLSDSMYEIILVGESGAFTSTQHLEFIQSRKDTSSWQDGATEALYRYGDCEDIIEFFESTISIPQDTNTYSPKVYELVLLCSMQQDRQDIFDEVYTLQSDLDTFAFWASKPQGKYQKLIEARKYPTTQHWQDFIDKISQQDSFTNYIKNLSEENSTQIFSLWMESYTQLESLISIYQNSREKIENSNPTIDTNVNTEETEETTKTEETENIQENSTQPFSSDILFSVLTATVSSKTHPNTYDVLNQISSNPYHPSNIDISIEDLNCMILASASHVPSKHLQQFTEDVLTQYLQENYLVGRYETHVMNKCNPLYFAQISQELMQFYEAQQKEQPDSTIEHIQIYLAAQWWQLFGARSQLGAYDITKSQKSLKQFSVSQERIGDVTSYPEEIQAVLHEQNVMYLYLRSLSREFAGDLAGIEKYARVLKDFDPSLAALRMGKANLLRQQKAESIWILYGEKELILPENLLQEHADLGAIAQRMNGSGNKMVLHHETIKYGLLERSTDFRVWYSNHIHEVLQYPHKNIPTMSLLINNARADKDGPGLLQSHFDEQIHLQSILLRQHLIFLFHSFKGNNTSESWNNFSTIQKRWSQNPFPQIWNNPEFTIQLEKIVDFDSMLADL